MSRKHFSAHPVPPGDKTFTVNGAVPPAKYPFYYLVPPLEFVTRRLIPPLLRDEACIMLHGRRSSGKTTCLKLLQQELVEKHNVCALFVSFQKSINFSSADVFWPSLGRALAASNTGVVVPPFVSASDFEDFLRFTATFRDRRVVLLLDEFDELYEKADARLKESVLGLIRGLKQEAPKGTTAFLGCVAAGPFSILRLTGESGSPFNVSQAVEAPVLSLDQCRNLLVDQWATARRVTLDPAVVDDIHWRTAGHTGLVSFCGKMLDEQLLRGRGTIEPITEADWFRYVASDEFRGELSNYPNAVRLVRRLVNAPQESPVASARRLLCNRFLPPSDLLLPVGPDDREVQLAEFLVAEGALTRLPGEKYQVSSLLIGQLLTAKVLPLERRHLHHPLETQMAAERLISPTRFFLSALRNFDGAELRQSIATEYKAVPEVPGGYALSESAYHRLMVIVLSMGAPNSVRLSDQARAPSSRKRCDIFLDFSKSQRICVELVASATERELRAHWEQLGDYMRLLRATDGWLFHFTVTPLELPSDVDEAAKSWVWPADDAPFGMMHVWHDLECAKMRVFWRERAATGAWTMRHEEIQLAVDDTLRQQ